MIVDLLREVDPPLGYDSHDHRYFVKDNTGKRLQQTIHVGQLVLPADLAPISRSATIPFSVLQGDAERVDGFDVLRIGTAGLDTLKEREAELLLGRGLEINAKHSIGCIRTCSFFLLQNNAYAHFK